MVIDDQKTCRSGQKGGTRVDTFQSVKTKYHPEDIKGAEATASAIFMARKGSNKEDIRAYIVQEFGYDLSRTCDQIRPMYHHVESCQQIVPEAITAFLERTNFEDVIRTAVSLGGDCDTLTCIACGIAEAFYDVPKEMLLECKKRLPDDMLEVITRFMDCRKSFFHDPFLAGNELIEEAIDKFYMDSCKNNLVGVLEAIRQRMHADGHFMFPVEQPKRQAGVKLSRTIIWQKEFFYQRTYRWEANYCGFRKRHCCNCCKRDSSNRYPFPFSRLDIGIIPTSPSGR